MLQDLESGLRKFHDLFGGGRCDGWQLEELLVRAIQSDTQAQHNVYWQEGGHDDKADMQVRTNGERIRCKLSLAKSRESAILS